MSAKFSNWGSWVDVCAPGMGIVSTFTTFPAKDSGRQPHFTGRARWDGTSFAAPQVAAVLAERMRKDPSPRAAVAWLLDEQCHFEPTLADYGLVFGPHRSLH